MGLVNVVFPPAARIYHLKIPTLPQYRFEYHPKLKKVYLIRSGTETPIGEPLAHDIENHGAAWNAVLIWSRGYREAERIRAIPDARSA